MKKSKTLKRTKAKRFDECFMRVSWKPKSMATADEPEKDLDELTAQIDKAVETKTEEKVHPAIERQERIPAETTWWEWLGNFSCKRPVESEDC